MSIIDQQIGLSNKVVNGRDIDIGEMMAKGHAVALSQQRISDEGRKTSGYFSGSIQGGSVDRLNLYPDNNNPFVSVGLDYKGIEDIRPPKPPNPPVKPPPPVEEVKEDDGR